MRNPDFNRVQFEAVRSEAGLNRFVMTPTKWITQMDAIGKDSMVPCFSTSYVDFVDLKNELLYNFKR